jgi:hypothetical protein
MKTSTQFATHYGTKLTPLRLVPDGFSDGRQLVLCTLNIPGGPINLPIQRDDIVGHENLEAFLGGQTTEPPAAGSISIADDDGLELETVLLQGADKLVSDLTNESTTRDRSPE